MDGGQLFGANVGKFEWTDEFISRLKQRWDQGATASQIGLEFGTTRNSIIGKVNRLQLQRHANGRTLRALSPEKIQSIVDKLRAGCPPQEVADWIGCNVATIYKKVKSLGLSSLVKQRTKRDSPRPKQVKREQGPALVHVPEVDRPALASKAFGEPCSLLELRFWGCRWPVSDTHPYMFCSGQRDGARPYCREHYALACRPARDDIYIPRSAL